MSWCVLVVLHWMMVVLMVRRVDDEVVLMMARLLVACARVEWCVNASPLGAAARKRPPWLTPFVPGGRALLLACATSQPRNHHHSRTRPLTRACLSRSDSLLLVAGSAPPALTLLLICVRFVRVRVLRVF